MKLIQKQTLFYVVCHEEDLEYYKEETYVFPSMEEVEKFLGAKNDYKKNIFCKGTDVYGKERSIEYNEIPDSIYSQTGYLIDWDCEDE